MWARIGAARFLTTNEKRKALGFGPLPGGDALTGVEFGTPSGEQKSLYAPDKRDEVKEPLLKVWKTVRDERTRESHQAANDQVRFMDEPFLVGEAELMEPRK